MSEYSGAFHVGDKVVHWSYGIGEIVQVDEKRLSGHTQQYYVVQTSALKLWVPLTADGEQSLRHPTPAEEFERLFQLLSGPSEALSPDRYQRKTQLDQLLNDRSIESVCRVIRDLTHQKKTGKFNENDSVIMQRAMSFLLEEWSMVLSLSRQQAELDLKHLLSTTVL